MSVARKLLKSWWPGAGSSSILNLELPVISIIISIYSYKSLIDYANALAIFMFANAFVYPLTTVVIKQGLVTSVRKFSFILILSVFILANILFLYYGLIHGYDLLLSHLFSISLLAVGMRRYLHGVVILKEATSIILPASIVRLIVSTSGCYLLISHGLSNAYAPVVALVSAAWIESMILFVFVHNKKHNILSTPRGTSGEGIFRIYFSALFIMASALMSNSFITYLINASDSSSKSFQLEAWAMLFGVVCIATSSIFDVENFIIRYDAAVKKQTELFGFFFVAFMSAIFMSAIYIIFIFYVMSPENIEPLSAMICPIALLSVLISLCWLVRSYTRAKLIMMDSTKIIISSIGMSFILVYLARSYIVLSDEYQLLLSLLFYLMIIIVELLMHFIFLIARSLKERFTV